MSQNDMSYPSGSSVFQPGVYTETDLSSYQYCGFLPASDGKITSVATSGVCGILQDKPVGSSGVPTEAALLIAGGGRMKVNGNSVNIAVLDPLKLTTGGVGIKAATDKDCAVAFALQAATADGLIIPIWKPGPGVWIAV